MQISNAVSAVKSWFEARRGPPAQFAQVFEKELEAVHARRPAPAQEGPLSKSASGGDAPAYAGLPVFEDPKGALNQALNELRAGDDAWQKAVADPEKQAFKHPGLLGLALSGGGIRSATFNLGVLQILDKKGIYGKLDYLSTVSGGGYIGCCLHSLYASGQQDFPFRHHCGNPENQRFKHLREYSNYLAPHGLADRLRMPALFVRGLVLNFLLILPFVLAAAGAYVLLLQYSPAIGLMFRDFYFSSRLLAILAAAILVYPIAKRISGLYEPAGDGWKARETLTCNLGLCFGAVAAIAFVEAQPHAFDFYHYLSRLNRNKAEWIARVPWGDLIGGIAALVGAVSAFVAARRTATAEVAQKPLSLWLVGILGPVLFWLLFLVLAKWALYPGTGRIEQLIMDTGAWLQQAVAASGAWTLPAFSDQSAGRAAGYLLAALVLYLYGWGVNVNDYSLHGFYRDRLSKAYLMRAAEDTVPPGHNDKQSLAPGSANPRMPYHLINAALNVTTPEKEKTGTWLRSPGRTAESFFFSRDFSGSDATGYCKTAELEKSDPWFNLGTAMAISGAAFAPNMGNATVRPLAFVLTMLNVRLCYWLMNPRVVNSSVLRARAKLPGRWLLFKELFSSLDASDDYVNLSDGGHMDNLGVYELLRRRCRLIIASDAEADPQYRFEGLATVCRLAQIDMGLMIEFDKKDLDAIREGLRHHAVGKINYTDGIEGRIIYLKASVTRGGDSVYIDRYRALHPDFPHETTMDQFYDEEQFECYRALGYEAAQNTF